MDSVKEQLPKLITENMHLIHNFKADLYKKSFDELFQANRALFTQIDALYMNQNSDVEKEQFVKEIAKDFVSKVKVYFEANVKKSKQDTSILDYNMVMSSFVIPCIMEYRAESTEALTDALLTEWNAAFTKYRIQKGTFADIDGAFKRKLCYITTAVCDNLQKADDCYELTTLRAFRDNYMMHSENGKGLVKEYYETAPALVMRMNQFKESRQIYQEIYNRYIKPCISYIEQNQYEKCEKMYINMVHTLEQQYIGGAS